MFGVPVRVHPMFWVLAAFLGWDPYFNRFGFGYLLLWVVCVFISILLHEFGHVLAGRVFGTDGHILLYWFGGLAYGSSDLRKRWQRVVVYLAGPGVQLLLFLAVIAVAWFAPLDEDGAAFATLEMLVEINLFWALFNLLPIYPLDGGRVTREACEVVAPGRGAIFAMGVSTLVCAGIALYILLSAAHKVPRLPYLGDNMFNALLFAWLAVNSYQAMQFEQARQRWDDRLPWER
jgi:Zn-dependent protease